MSGLFAMPLDHLTFPDLSSPERIVLVFCWAALGSTGEGAASAGSLCETAGLSRATVFRSLKALRQKGLIVGTRPLHPALTESHPETESHSETPSKRPLPPPDPPHPQEDPPPQGPPQGELPGLAGSASVGGGQVRPAWEVHLERARALCLRLPARFPRWEILNDERKTVIRRRMAAEGITDPDAFWDRAEEVLLPFDEESVARWSSVRLETFLRPGTAAHPDHWTAAVEGQHRLRPNGASREAEIARRKREEQKQRDATARAKAIPSEEAAKRLQEIRKKL